MFRWRSRPRRRGRPNVGPTRPVRVRAAVPALRAEASTAPANSSKGEGPSTVMIRSRAASASSPGRVRGVDFGSPRRALVHQRAVWSDGGRRLSRPCSTDLAAIREADEEPGGPPTRGGSVQRARWPGRDELTRPQARAGRARARSTFTCSSGCSWAAPSSWRNS